MGEDCSGILPGGCYASGMGKRFFLLLAMACAVSVSAWGTTISVVPVFEPISLHGTDVDGDITEIGEALQAMVCSRPMALTGAFPEDLVEAVRSPHLIPSNNPNYKVTEANLAVLCGIRLTAETTDAGLQVTVDVGALAIPADVDLTQRQVVLLVLVAVRKTLEAYQQGQTDKLKVVVAIDGATEGRAHLKGLATEFELAGAATSR